MPDFLLYSIIASIVLTIIFNLGLRLIPRSSKKASDFIHTEIEKAAHSGGPNVRVIFPWKTMIVISVILSLALNLDIFAAPK